MTPNTKNQGTPELKIILGITLSNCCKRTNDRKAFNIGVETIGTGIREHIQQDKPLHDIGEIFINAQK